jgi:hypothetical protein
MVCTLRWVLLFCLSLVGLAVSAVLGWMDELYRLDPTFISFAIIGLYSIVTLFVGWPARARPGSTSSPSAASPSSATPGCTACPGRRSWRTA